jgi:hypothetical protein
MKHKVFYSFHHQLDSWRASTIRSIGIVEGNQPASDNDWEAVKLGKDPAIRRWIDQQLKYRVCTIVLIGAETATRKWVNYEIEQSWNNGLGLLGIRIHRLLNQNQQTSIAGPDPFTTFSLSDGRNLSSVVNTYNPIGGTSKEVYANISDNLAMWIDSAIAIRKRN